MYHIIDTKTGNVIGKDDSGRHARARAHRLDAAYGAVRYVVRYVTTPA